MNDDLDLITRVIWAMVIAVAVLLACGFWVAVTALQSVPLDLMGADDV